MVSKYDQNTKIRRRNKRFPKKSVSFAIINLQITNYLHLQLVFLANQLIYFRNRRPFPLLRPNRNRLYNRCCIRKHLQFGRLQISKLIATKYNNNINNNKYIIGKEENKHLP